MEIIRPQPKTYRTRRRKPLAQPKSYRVVSEEVDGQKFQRVELAFRWMPWITSGVLTVSLLRAKPVERFANETFSWNGCNQPL
jgi:hypothetical protein